MKALTVSVGDVYLRVENHGISVEAWVVGKGTGPDNTKLYVESMITIYKAGKPIVNKLVNLEASKFGDMALVSFQRVNNNIVALQS